VESFATYDAGASIGGPIVRDRLWFFGAFDASFEDHRVKLPGFDPEEDKLRSKNFAGKLTWQASQSTDVTFSVFGNPGTRRLVGDGAVFGEIPQSLENIDAVLGHAEVGGVSSSLAVRSLARENLLLDGSVALSTQTDNVWGETLQGREEPAFFDKTTRTRSGGYGLRDEIHTTRVSVGLNAMFLLNTHQVKVGAAYEENVLDLYHDRTDPGLITKQSPSFYTALFTLQDLDVRNRVPSVYAQDSWRVAPWLRLNFGVRWDGQYLIGSDGDLAQPLRSQVQPRFGFVLQPGQEGKHRVFGSLGRFYQQFPLNQSVLGHSRWEQGVDFYSQDPRNPGVSPIGTQPIVTPDAYDIARIKDLRGEHSDEFVLGYDFAFVPSLKARVRGVYRTLREAFVGGFDHRIGESGGIVAGNPGRGAMSFLPRPKREYAAIELTLERARTGTVDFFLSYVLSRNYGNYPGFFDAYKGDPFPGGNPGLFSADQIPNSTGLLPNDRTHVFKARGAQQLVSGLSLGLAFSWMSGTPLSELGPPAPILVPNRFMYVVKRGSAGRTPSVWDLNFRATYELSFRSLPIEQGRLVLDLLHVGNPRRAVFTDQVRYYAVGEENPDFGQVLRYQPPMAVRLGLEVGF
jgi:hypothetical protein